MNYCLRSNQPNFCGEVRTLVEGSTVVMQAINTNIEKNLKKAGPGQLVMARGWETYEVCFKFLMVDDVADVY